MLGIVFKRKVGSEFRWITPFPRTNSYLSWIRYPLISTLHCGSAYMADDLRSKTKEAFRKILVQLARTPSIPDSEPKRLFNAEGSARMPPRMSPRLVETWENVIFRGNFEGIAKSPKGISDRYFRRTEKIVRDELKLIPSNTERANRTWLEYLIYIHGLLSQSNGGPESQREEQEPAQAPADLRAALSILLGMKADQHYNLNKTVVGEYFGYRRSSNRGRIVRFYIKIEPAAAKGLLSFQNEYHQDPDHWRVRGCGFDNEGLTYLIGHACEAGDEEAGLGMRFFVLSKFRKLRWYVGLLNSLDRNQQPIASRIVLIPVSQHTLGNTSAPLTSRQIIRHISSKDLSAQTLDRQIKVKDPRALKGNPVSTLVQALIWNGTLRTLHSPNTDIPGKKDGAAYKRVFEFQRAALTPPPKTTNDIEFFARLLDSNDVREATMPHLPLSVAEQKP
jgi:hypothetical protein